MLKLEKVLKMILEKTKGLTMSHSNSIDMVEEWANVNEYEFQRFDKNQISVAVEGQWRTYNITIAKNDDTGLLQLVCVFDLNPPEDRLVNLYETINLINEKMWVGAFSYWKQEQLMTFRYALIFEDDRDAAPEQIDRMIDLAFTSSEQYYPAIQTAIYTNKTPTEAVAEVIYGCYGTA